MSSNRSLPSSPSAGTCTPSLPGFTCGLDATLRVISGKWKPLILYFLAQDGPIRYGELRRAVRDVSDKMLIQQLKELEADDLVKRTDYKEIPPRVDYGLTPWAAAWQRPWCRSAFGARRTWPRSPASSPSARPRTAKDGKRSDRHRAGLPVPLRRGVKLLRSPRHVFAMAAVVACPVAVPSRIRGDDERPAKREPPLIECTFTTRPAP